MNGPAESVGKVYVPRRVLESIRDVARETYPNECCGALIGEDRDGERYVHDLIAFENARTGADRRNRYLMDARDVMAAEDAAAARGLLMVGTFHSHPDGRPVPSSFDLSWAWPWYTYIITAVAGEFAGQLRAWRLAEDESRFLEQEIVEVE